MAEAHLQDKNEGREKMKVQMLKLTSPEKMNAKRYFEGIAVYASKIGELENRAAFALPGIGIFVNPKDVDNTDLLRHEFGHVLQARKWGSSFFYGTIVLTSIKSAAKANKDPNFDHMDTWTEWTANFLSYKYFNQPKDWDLLYYPIQPNINRPGSAPPMRSGKLYLD